MPIRIVAVLVVLTVPLMALTADDVTDMDMLREFVKEARDEFEPRTRDVSREAAYDIFDAEVRPKSGPWRNDDIYFFLIDSEEPDRGYLLFHGEVMGNEGNDTWDSVSMDGVYLGRELIRNAGRRFSRWRHDRPFVEGDEEEGSLKIAWSEPINIAGDAFILGSGI